MFGAADQVVEAIHLPEAAGVFESRVDLSSLIPLPRFNPRQHDRLRAKRGQCVNVVRHDDEVGQPIVLIVEMPQVVGDDLGQLRTFQNARAVAFVEEVIEVFRVPNSPAAP